MSISMPPIPDMPDMPEEAVLIAADAVDVLVMSIVMEFMSMVVDYLLVLAITR
jgi:hypothetical protein